MRPDLIINNISMNSLGWLRESMDFPVPQAQTETVTVPGRNTPIRYTEALGRAAYEPRSFSAVFTMLGIRAEFNSKVKVVANTFAGELCKVITSEERDLYAYGTLQAEASYDPITGIGTLTLSCEDGDSYKYHVEETIVMVARSGTAVLKNDFMPVVPVITTTAETTLNWFVGEESFSKTLSVGKWEIPELELHSGTNTVSVSGTGTTTFTYREGCL